MARIQISGAHELCILCSYLLLWTIQKTFFSSCTSTASICSLYLHLCGSDIGLPPGFPFGSSTFKKSSTFQIRHRLHNVNLFPHVAVFNFRFLCIAVEIAL